MKKAIDIFFIKNNLDNISKYYNTVIDQIPLYKYDLLKYKHIGESLIKIIFVTLIIGMIYVYLFEFTYNNPLLIVALSTLLFIRLSYFVFFEELSIYYMRYSKYPLFLSVIILIISTIIGVIPLYKLNKEYREKTGKKLDLTSGISRENIDKIIEYLFYTFLLFIGIGLTNLMQFNNQHMSQFIYRIIANISTVLSIGALIFSILILLHAIELYSIKKERLIV
tara:strand:- start:472 stop:1140 length:669 start_codon:yes stop_codon:yes gene_type:complete